MFACSSVSDDHLVTTMQNTAGSIYIDSSSQHYEYSYMGELAW